MSDPYHTKWSGYKKPDWYHPYNGTDWRSEYMYSRRDRNVPVYLEWADEAISNNRFIFYLTLFGLSQMYAAFKAYRR